MVTSISSMRSSKIGKILSKGSRGSRGKSGRGKRKKLRRMEVGYKRGSLSGMTRDWIGSRGHSSLTRPTRSYDARKDLKKVSQLSKTQLSLRMISLKLTTFKNTWAFWKPKCLILQVTIVHIYLRKMLALVKRQQMIELSKTWLRKKDSMLIYSGSKMHETKKTCFLIIFNIVKFPGK